MTARLPQIGSGSDWSRGYPSVLGWAAYLACSWTWCIGMFLPVLLVRDYGLWGFVAFALPNVAGAAGMGWVLARPGQAERLRERHAVAVRAFSLVTIAFQCFFVGWLVQWAAPGPVVGAVALAAAAAAFMLRSVRGTLLLAILVWLTSAACLVGYVVNAGASLPEPRPMPTGLLWLAPVCAFGFALCPYLDPTFLRAAAALDTRGRRAAFTIGFGLLFAAMIAFTLLYGATVERLGAAASGATLAGTLVLIHVGVQIVFTVGAHVRELASVPALGRGRAAQALVAGIAAAMAAFSFNLGSPVVADAGMPVGEIVYRVFMAFYGLVFPAYVWICMIPTRDGHAGLAGKAGRRKALAWAAAVGIAAPLFWMGFIERHEVYLVPGLLVVLLTKLAVRSRPGS
ncbi:MAG TPA: hypothetical protein PLU35_09690 [Phycisphaerales bacterium]|nr:hypothetical protein [Phycisphaerales bacterium]